MPYTLTVSKNGGAPTTGAITCAAGDTIRLRVTPTSGFRTVRFELYGYPAGWPTPAGWTLDASSRVIYSTSVTPDDFTLPSAQWGKWLLRVLIDGASADDTSALEIVSPNGLHALPAGEGSQFGGAAERWGKHLEENLRTIDSSLGSSYDSRYGMGLDGARTESAGGPAAAIDRPRNYTDLTLSNATTLSMGGQKLVGNGTLTVGASCALHNDGGDASGGTAGGTGGAVQGQLANAAGANGGSGGSTGANGVAGSGQTRALGGAGGKGGDSNDAHTGGAGGSVTLPAPLSDGLIWWAMGLEFLACWNGANWQRCVGGSPGGGGAGSAAGAGTGAGQGGGLAGVAFKKIVIEAGGRISCRGGKGANSSNSGAGSGAGGGGGFLIVFCDEFVGDYSALDCSGGTGGTTAGGGEVGATGSPGRVMLFVKGKLVYSSGF